MVLLYESTSRIMHTRGTRVALIMHNVLLASIIYYYIMHTTLVRRVLEYA